MSFIELLGLNSDEILWAFNISGSHTGYRIAALIITAILCLGSGLIFGPRAVMITCLFLFGVAVEFCIFPETPLLLSMIVVASIMALVLIVMRLGRS
jgi:hypothetical protein